MSHRGSSRLARVIPSMHGHLCVVWWLFSSPVSFSSLFRCSSSRPSRRPPPSSTRSSCPKTCATSAWGPWPVMTTRHPSHDHLSCPDTIAFRSASTATLSSFTWGLRSRESHCHAVWSLRSRERHCHAAYYGSGACRPINRVTAQWRCVCKDLLWAAYGTCFSQRDTKTLSCPGLPMDTLLWYCLLWMVSASRILGCIAVAPRTRFPRVRPHALVVLCAKAPGLSGGRGGWQWRSLRLLALPFPYVVQQTLSLVPLHSDSPLSSQPQPRESDGDVTPRKDTRETLYCLF